MNTDAEVVVAIRIPFASRQSRRKKSRMHRDSGEIQSFFNPIGGRGSALRLFFLFGLGWGGTRTTKFEHRNSKFLP